MSTLYVHWLINISEANNKTLELERQKVVFQSHDIHWCALWKQKNRVSLLKVSARQNRNSELDSLQNLKGIRRISDNLQVISGQKVRWWCGFWIHLCSILYLPVSCTPRETRKRREHQQEEWLDWWSHRWKPERGKQFWEFIQDIMLILQRERWTYNHNY